MTDHEHTNRLVDETSPYLLQHAHNPVDWYPWGEEALEKARREDKPIFLSIGYSACHWCHVMERESFEDEEIAQFLNEHFVSVKVDREERPDLDRIYMNAVQVMTGQGGWPMSVFLTPERKPFYAGTYFPPEDKWGRPGFKTVLKRLAEMWEEDDEQIDDSSERITERLEQLAKNRSNAQNLTREPLENAFSNLSRVFDRTYGGFDEAPKFPPSMQLRFLLNVWADDDTHQEKRRDRAMEMVETTLAYMASGGMYDQIGGGFHRYSVDDKWLVPHFEKMLYDNALLTKAYTAAFRATGREFYARVTRETLDYVRREMTFGSDAHDFGDDKAPFYSTQDADSEGEEGKYFVWTPATLADVLDDDEVTRAREYWGITKSGNFEGASIPNRLHALDERGHDAAFEELPDDIREIRQKLFEARQDRVPPGTDTKILAAWNGLMIGAMSRAGFALDEPEYIEAGENAARFVLEEMVEGDLDGDFQLMRTFKDGRARFPGYLDDFAFLASGLVDLYEATGEWRWLRDARRIAERMNALFWDEDGGFYYTAEHHDDVLVRDKDSLDNATPAGNSVAAEVLLRLSTLLSEDELRDRADETLRAFFPRMQRRARSMTEMLQALEYHMADPRELVIVVPEDADARQMRDVARRAYLPNGVTIVADLSDADLDTWAERIPLLEGRAPRDDKPTAFLCRQGTCKQPTTNPAELREMLTRD